MLTLFSGRIYLVLGPTDMRKSFDTLAGVVRERLGAEPMQRDTFVFCNQHRTRLKILVYDESGAWVMSKRLDRGTFAWPAGDANERPQEVQIEQLVLLLRGFDAVALKPRRWRRRRLALAPVTSEKSQRF